MYELIKGDEKGIVDPNNNSLSIEEGYTDEKLESGRHCSMSKSNAGVVSRREGGGEEASNRRLASLDVFRGVTVAVRTESFILHVFIFCSHLV